MVDHLKPIIRTSLNSQFQNFISQKCLNVSLKPQRVLIDFSSPNIAKPFHPGHLRATLIGNFVANINKVFGHDVCRINYLGDWGKQFGFLLYGLKKFNSKPLQELKLENFFEIYSRSYGIFKDTEYEADIKNILLRLDNGDEELTQMWSDIKCNSLQNLKSIYKRLGIEFDVYEFESDYNTRGKQYIWELEKKICSIYHDDKTVFYMINPYTKLPLLSREGLSLYISRDIAAAVSRLEVYKPDRMHYVVENGQFLHFETLKQILQDIGHKINDFTSSVYPTDFHIKFNRVNKMSTRKGNVIFIESMLDNAKSSMIKKLKSEKKVTLTNNDNIEELAEKLALTILFSEFLKTPRQNPFDFSWDRDNLGFKLQYCRASLNSLEERCYEKDIHPDLNNCFDFETYDYFKNYPTSLNLFHHIIKYDDVLYRCYKESESCLLMNYITQLVGYINNALRETKVISCNSKSEAATRLKLFSVSKFILDHSYDLLGFPEIYKI